MPRLLNEPAPTLREPCPGCIGTPQGNTKRSPCPECASPARKHDPCFGC
ncbi:hypothetical protein DGo_PC0262 (plasmid) [Deinococcus gobiensis I-0]|uniref:Uncharacterized protein n=1 Tax=Deinococcus gobiensis (strain DSM 21396 / JCM 16679 / CGMCC 1.7299 / I-0) TaxID=745776 RepID=H8H3F7_DEIGI|nr:hypothetical protein DGo_PC0262 [Deinococcus gobiensis I-0]